MDLKQRLSKTLSIISMAIIAALFIAACGSSGLIGPINGGKLTICHVNGNTTSPYDEITLDFNGLAAHVDHKGDLIPAPAGGCPIALVTGNNGKITICHATGSATNPYTEITIVFNGLNGHSDHKGDFIPAPESGCPLVTPTPGNTATSTITATPSGTLTPTVAASGSQDGKITICHHTGSSKNPYVLITVSVNGLNGHDKHSGDIIPAPGGGCPK